MQSGPLRDLFLLMMTNLQLLYTRYGITQWTWQNISLLRLYIKNILWCLTLTVAFKLTSIKKFFFAVRECIEEDILRILSMYESNSMEYCTFRGSRNSSQDPCITSSDSSGACFSKTSACRSDDFSAMPFVEQFVQETECYRIRHLWSLKAQTR